MHGAEMIRKFNLKQKKQKKETQQETYLGKQDLPESVGEEGPGYWRRKQETVQVTESDNRKWPHAGDRRTLYCSD